VISAINILSRDVEAFLRASALRDGWSNVVESLHELRGVLEGRARAPGAIATLDLIGHSTRGHKLLRLGRTVIDMLDPSVERFFVALADDGLLDDVAAVRLLGCETAVSPSGQRTIRTLGWTLGLPVYGTKKPLFKSHYDARGFDPAFGHVLVESTQLRPFA
jgi:hypothetical protein